jgi:carboxyl-terminal processing protease
MNIQKQLLIIVMSLTQSSAVLSQATPDAPDAEAKELSAAQLTLDDLRTFTDVFSQVRRNYVEEVDDKTLLNDAIMGMLSKLDPHSDYLPAEDYKLLDDAAQGHYSGIGVDVRIEDQRIVIKKVIVPSPADSAGLNPGDVITAINGQPVKGRMLHEAINELSGDPGTSIRLQLLLPEGEQREVEMIREYVNVPTVSFELLDRQYGYFRVAMFNRNSATHLEESLQSIREDGIILRGLIIDLRNNPGGVLQQAVSMADGFLDEGLIVSTRGRNATMQMEFSANEGQWLPDTPIVILVDRGTASASEVVAGALQDHGRALIVGERTFGKGSVQSVLPLRNGAGIKLTTARYYTPSGRSIQAEGIRPDIVVEPVKLIDAEDGRIREADLDRHLENDRDVKAVLPDVPVSAADDFALHEALSILKAAGILSGNIRPQGDAQPNQEEGI